MTCFSLHIIFMIRKKTTKKGKNSTIERKQVDDKKVSDSASVNVNLANNTPKQQNKNQS